MRGPGHLRAPSGSRVLFGKQKAATYLEGPTLLGLHFANCWLCFCVFSEWATFGPKRCEHETGNIQDADIDYIIDDQLTKRMQDALNYTVSSLTALKEGGIETETPGLTYPNMYDE